MDTKQAQQSCVIAHLRGSSYGYSGFAPSGQGSLHSSVSKASASIFQWPIPATVLPSGGPCTIVLGGGLAALMYASKSSAHPSGLTQDLPLSAHPSTFTYDPPLSAHLGRSVRTRPCLHTQVRSIGRHCRELYDTRPGQTGLQKMESLDNLSGVSTING